MLPLSPSELSSMKETQEAAMMDECQIGVWEEGVVDEFNLPSNEGYNYASAIKCGLVFGNSRHIEVMQATQVPQIATMIRLPHGTAVDTKDRIKVTKRFGVTEASPKTYNVIGHPKAGPSGLLVSIDMVTNGSDS